MKERRFRNNPVKRMYTKQSMRNCTAAVDAVPDARLASFHLAGTAQIECMYKHGIGLACDEVLLRKLYEAA